MQHRAPAKHAGRIGVFGRSGSGKSTYVKALMRSRQRIIVFDPLDEYGREGVARVDKLNAVTGIVKDSYARFAIAYVPPASQEVEALNRLSALAKAMQRPYLENRSQHQLTLVVEELNLSFPVAGGDQKNPGFAELCSRGRHSGIEVIGVSQRVAEVATRFRGNLSEAIVFQQRGKLDRIAAAGCLGADSTQVVNDLEKFEYLREQDGRLERQKLPPLK